jgi:hypothetical protein
VSGKGDLPSHPVEQPGRPWSGNLGGDNQRVGGVEEFEPAGAIAPVEVAQCGEHSAAATT